MSQPLANQVTGSKEQDFKELFFFIEIMTSEFKWLEVGGRGALGKSAVFNVKLPAGGVAIRGDLHYDVRSVLE